MELDQQLRTHLAELLRGGNAHMPISEAVADFPNAMINARPANIDYTFWHLLEHLRITQNDILTYMTELTYQEIEWPRDYWPAKDATATRAEWNETIAALNRDLEQIVAMVENPSVNLLSTVPSNNEHTVLREVLIVADHNAYHIGELGILRQVENAWGKEHK